MENKLLILEAFAFTLESFKYAEAERNFQESRSAIGALGDGCGRKAACENTNDKTATASNTGDCAAPTTNLSLSLSEQIKAAREHVIQSLTTPTSSFVPSSGGVEIDPEMKAEVEILKKKVECLDNLVKQLSEKVAKLEGTCKSGSAPVAASQAKTVPPPKAAAEKKVEEDDDVDLFGSDEEEDAEAKAHKEKLLAEYQAKKSKKPAVIAKSNVILDVKPWDDETDMKELEKAVRSIVMDGLLWGTSKLVPVGYGIKKLQIATVVEDDKVSIDELTEKIQEFEDFVQSVDIAAFNKI